METIKTADYSFVHVFGKLQLRLNEGLSVTQSAVGATLCGLRRYVSAELFLPGVGRGEGKRKREEMGRKKRERGKLEEGQKLRGKAKKGGRKRENSIKGSLRWDFLYHVISVGQAVWTGRRKLLAPFKSILNASRLICAARRRFVLIR